MRDKFSQERINKLHPKVREVFIDFINECEEKFDITLRIIQGYRSIEEQNALYEQGRSKSGLVVTNAKGGQSFHNFGLAVDLAEVVDDDIHIDWSYDTSKLQPIASKYNITWGGNWTHLKDKPHFEMNFNHGSSGYKFFLDLYNSNKVDENGYIIF